MGSKIGKQISEGKKFLAVESTTSTSLLTKEQALEEASRKTKVSRKASASYLVVEVVSEVSKKIEVILAELDEE